MLRLALAVLLLPSALCAQLTEKQAVAQLKGDLKDALKEAKASLAGAAQSFEGSLDAQLGQLSSGQAPASFIAFLAGFAAELQQDVRTAIELGYVRAAAGAVLALEALDPAIDLTLGFPQDFVPGAGGALDDYEADLHKLIDKTYAKLEKRLAKAAKAAEKEGVGFTWRLGPPLDAFAYEVAPGGGSMNPATPLRIDVVFAASALAEDDDGTLAVLGLANAGANDVELDIYDASLGHDTVAAPVTLGTDRWSVITSDIASSGGVPEVGYSLVANQEGGGSYTGVPFGVR